MIFRTTHSTTYMYNEPVSICHTEVHLQPRKHWRQTLLEHTLTVHPPPDFQIARQDYFGNEVVFFTIHHPHTTLTITSVSLVNLPSTEAPHPALTPPWEQAAALVKESADDRAFEANQFTYDSHQVKCGPEFAEYGAVSFPPGRPVLEGVLDLQRRIFNEFKYDQRATTVTTPLDEVLRGKQGVCQDFAHFMIACLRSLGLPARYVSGYMKSGENSIGAEASHAWVSVYTPGFGWLDFDPTNNVMPDAGHVTVAWGRDYSDVTPVKGVALGGGEQFITVSVEVVPMDS